MVVLKNNTAKWWH